MIMIKNQNIFYNIAAKIDEIFHDMDAYKEVYQIDNMQAEEEMQWYTALKVKAVLGDKSARTYIIHQFAKILSSKLFDLSEKDVDSIICFTDIQKNDVQILFELLLQIYDVSQMIEKYNWRIRVTDKVIKEVVAQEEKLLQQRFSGYKDKIYMLATLIYAKEYGQDCIDTLQHHCINEIGVIDKDYIYVVYKNVKIHLSFLRFENRNVILNIQKKTTQNSAVHYDEHNPTVVAAKNNASRITVAGYDTVPFGEDIYYNERIFNLAKITLEEMRDTYATINGLVYHFLVLNQQGKGAHFVTGSDMGVGKSTFLLAMMEKVPDYWGIGILDTQNELQARNKYPWKNILTLIENPKRSIAQCFETMLKMARDVLYVGEITKPAEVSELINAGLRLNAGVGATLHSLSPLETVSNIRNLMMRTKIYNNAETAEADIAKAIDIIVHLARHPTQAGRIIVESIVELEYVEQERYIEPMMEGSTRQQIVRLVQMMQMAVQKYLYRKPYRYNVIIRYDEQKDTWLPVAMPSKVYFEKICKHVSREKIEAFTQLFIRMQKEGV